MRRSEAVCKKFRTFAAGPFYITMKPKGWIVGALSLAVVAFNPVYAIPPRTDINPALLYFQAFNKFPELEAAESKLLATAAAGPVSDEERAVASLFDTPFKLLRQARTMKAPCDWGSDIADGPQAFVPNLIKIRTAAHVASFRARIALADGQQTQARDELLAVSALGRNAAVGSSLVGTMIQVAVDRMVLDFISAHFSELKAQTRADLAAGLNGPPARQTVADAMANEQAGIQDWLIGKLEEFRGTKTDDAKVLDQFRGLMADTFASETDLADRIIEVAGGTPAGVIAYIKRVEPFYAQSLRIARASESDIKRETDEFEKAINNTTNLLARVVLPNIVRARTRELEFEARLKRLPNAAP